MTPAEVREAAAVLVEGSPWYATASLGRLAAAIRALPLAEEAPPSLAAVLSALPHLTGDELRRVAEATPRVAGEWEHRERWGQRTEDGHYGPIVAEWEHYENRHQAADAEEWDWTAERPVLARTVDADGTPVETWHETPRAAEAACDARLEAAGVRLCGEVVRDG